MTLKPSDLNALDAILFGVFKALSINKDFPNWTRGEVCSAAGGEILNLRMKPSDVAALRARIIGTPQYGMDGQEIDPETADALVTMGVDFGRRPAAVAGLPVTLGQLPGWKTPSDIRQRENQVIVRGSSRADVLKKRASELYTEGKKFPQVKKILAEDNERFQPPLASSVVLDIARAATKHG